MGKLQIQSGDTKAATDLLASISVAGNKDLKKNIHKLKKCCKP
ncbi:hypothetical protein GNIT_2986 [Glaciecola nitratireducens FR1064]|uniref:Uncharacterized protein n=1 Tax=Glaciecola nitratireducens (strain JCM 12485 / KCTC 12276 / FR1064) TaxID=1085623 RepID=G4QDQ3_GLANF|nr:hypothetical protein GNIT_2986 [Glaciecola nitratireducens FR1064]